MPTFKIEILLTKVEFYLHNLCYTYKMSVLKKKNEIVKDKVLRFLEEAKVPQSRVQILCAVYGFRCAAGNILSWSIHERQLLQNGDFQNAAKLLQNVVSECEEKGLQKNVIRALDNQNRFELVKLQQVQQQLRLSKYVTEALQVVTRELRDSLVSNAISDLEQRIQVYLQNWTWSIWRRHSVERKCADLASVINEKNEARVTISRAIKSLQEANKIKVEGTLKQTRISLLEPN
jgi:hypothetical protein